MSFRKIITSAVGVPESATDDEIATAMAEIIRPGSTTDAANLRDSQPTSTFAEMVTRVMANEKLNYGDAASKVSRERPDLYAAHVDDSRLS
jgi:hypothetical protein